MKTIAVKVSLDAGKMERLFEASSQEFIEKFCRLFWELPPEQDVEVVSLYSSQSEFKDVEFFSKYEEFFSNQKDVNNVFIEFGSAQFGGQIAGRMHTALINMINFIRMKFGRHTNLVVAYPRNFPTTSPSGKQALEILEEEIPNASIYLYNEHEFLSSCEAEPKCSKVISELRDDNRALFLTPTQKLGWNIVCHLGKFQTSGKDDQVVYDFYDGSRASSEVYVIIDDLISRAVSQKPEDESLVIVYDRGLYFQWFADALFNTEKDIYKRYGERLIVQSIQEYLGDGANLPADILLCPVVRSGDTVIRFKDTLDKLYPGQEFPTVHCLIYANSIDADEPKVVKLNRNGQNVSLHASVQRGARGAFLKEIWAESQFDAQLPEELLDYSLEFSSASMWAMLFETELGEENSSRKRTQLNRFPDFAKIFERNRPLFIHKIKAIEGRLGLTGSFKYIIPDELVPAMIAKNLCSEAKDKEASFVAIPSKILEIASAYVGSTWTEFEAAIHGDEDSSKNIVEQLKVLSEMRRSLETEGGHDTTQKSYCVLDVCRVTGKTLRGLEAIVGMLGGNVAASITIADFANMNEFAKPDSNYGTLYSFGG